MASLLKCKVCSGDMHVIGEVSMIEPLIKCSKCGLTNKKNNNNKGNNHRGVIIEYKR